MTPIDIGHYDGVPYVRTGTGAQPIVVINGGNAFVRRFDRESALRDARRIGRLFPRDHALCILGYDTSKESDVTEMASDVARIIRSQFGSAVVAGISFGGFVAARLTADHPGLVRKLILISTAGRFSAEGRTRVARQIDDAARGDLLSMARPFTSLFRRPWLNVGRFALWARRKSLSARMNEPAIIVRMLQAALTAGSGATSDFSAMRTPALIVGGTADQFFDRRAMEETAASMGSAELVLLENETHMLPVERAQAVAKVIDRFLRK